VDDSAHLPVRTNARRASVRTGGRIFSLLTTCNKKRDGKRNPARDAERVAAFAATCDQERLAASGRKRRNQLAKSDGVASAEKCLKSGDSLKA
jgi:hypothetical protein